MQMLRTILLTTSFALLAACQMTDQPQVTTAEERLAMSQETINTCALTECGRLNLDGQLVADYGQVAEMSHVTAFMASYSNFNDLSDISSMSQLRELHIGATQISDLDGLRNFPNLTLLHLQWSNNVSDLTPIGQLTQLTELAIGGYDVGDMAFLQGLRNLKSLNLENTEVTSLRALRAHPSLEEIDLVEAQLPDDISALTTIPNLKVVSVTEWNLSDPQKAVIEQLRARGVEIILEVAIVAC